MPGGEQDIFCSFGNRKATYIVMAHGVHVVLQVTLPVVGQDDPTQFPVSCEVETRVSGEHQQTGDVPPANLLL